MVFFIPLGQIDLIFISSCLLSVLWREANYGYFVKTSTLAVIRTFIELISFKLCMMIGITELYILIPG